ncbi:hypothetical protein [Streptomyces californicus]|uniref:hypothetical protein n=1 Tax=Streptomyces californicus TaxID=67351 RepID=UPI0035DFF45A
MSEIYVVSSGSYSDYRIVQIFGDEESAEAFAAKIYDGDVTAHTLRGPDFKMPRWSGRTTVISATGDIVEAKERSENDESGFYEGQVLSRVAGGVLPLEPYEVHTHGEAARVPQAHADAVAKLRAEVLGL